MALEKIINETVSVSRKKIQELFEQYYAQCNPDVKNPKYQESYAKGVCDVLLQLFGSKVYPDGTMQSERDKELERAYGQYKKSDLCKQHTTVATNTKYTQREVRDAVVKAFKQHCNEDPSPDDTLYDLGIGSLDLMCIMMDIENEIESEDLNIEENVTGNITVRELIDLVWDKYSSVGQSTDT